MFSQVNQSINNIIEVEGDYSDHPADKGGPTRFGITETVARAFGYTGSMQELPKTLAQDIYLQRYWTEPKFDQVAMISYPIASEMLDTGINMGQPTAVKFLQRALNTLNQQESKFPDVAVDGYLGSISLHALKTFLTQRSKDGELVLLRMLNAQQSVRYMEIAEKNKSQEAFQFGWQANRVA